MTVVETPSFLRDAAAMDEGERMEVVTYIASNPDAGEIMAETGGVRKLRWKAPGRGKRGGVRIIYYYHNDLFPLFLLSMFAKNEKANLTKTERNIMKTLLPRLTAGYHKRVIQ